MCRPPQTELEECIALFRHPVAAEILERMRGAPSERADAPRACYARPNPEAEFGLELNESTDGNVWILPTVRTDLAGR